MIDFDNEDSIKRLLKAAYGPVAPPPELRGQLLERLMDEARSASVGISRPLLARPRLVIPIMVGLISGLISYGSWLSLNLVPRLLP